MEIVFNTGSLVGQSHASLQEILERLNRTYRGSIGAEYMYISQTEQKRWIQNYLEGRQSQPNFSVEYKHHILSASAQQRGWKNICTLVMLDRNDFLAKAARA